MKQLLIHPGYPKTATTTFQEYLFSEHTRINYLGNGSSTPVNRRFIDQICTESDGLFRDNLPTYRNMVNQVLDTGKHITILSDELLLGAMPSCIEARVTLLQRAQRIRQLFETVENLQICVLVVLRNQADMITSRFVHNYHEFARCTKMRTVYDLLEEELRDRSKGIMHSLKYDAVLQDYVSIFGKEHIRVSLFEEFQQDPTLFVANLFKWLGLDAVEATELLVQSYNTKRKIRKKETYKRPHVFEFILRDLKSKHFRSLKLHKHRWGRFLIAQVQRIPNLRNNYVSLSSEERAIIGRYYEKTNKALIEKFGIPVEKYGYQI